MMVNYVEKNKNADITANGVTANNSKDWFVKQKKIDALVAETVFGYELKDRKMVGDQLIVLGTYNGERKYGLLPDYSTDMSAAWRVVDKMRERGLFYEMWGGKKRKKGCMFYPRKGENHEAEADTAALAICNAALKAVKSNK